MISAERLRELHCNLPEVLIKVVPSAAKDIEQVFVELEAARTRIAELEQMWADDTRRNGAEKTALEDALEKALLRAQGLSQEDRAQWIPVSERLPGIERNYWVAVKMTDKWHTECAAEYSMGTIYGRRKGWHKAGVSPEAESFRINDLVLAWRELPPPYDRRLGGQTT